MLPIISLIAFLCFNGVNVESQSLTLGSRDSVVGSLESFCYWTNQEQQPQFSTTCVTPSIPYPLSSSLDQFCSYFDEFQDEFQCRSVLGHNGGAPYPAAPGYENKPKQQLQQTIIFKTQPNGQQPIFFNQQTNQPFYFQKPSSRGPGNVVFNIQPQQPNNQQFPNFVIGNPAPKPGGGGGQPIFIVGQPQPPQPNVIQVPGGGQNQQQGGGGPIFVVNQPGKQQQVVTSGDGGDPNKPIVLTINVQGQNQGDGGNGGNTGGAGATGGTGSRPRPNIAGQSEDRQTEPPSPARATPAPAPVPPTEEDLTALVFKGDGADMVTRCPVGTPISWSYNTWTSGNVRPYYENYGPKSSLEDCMKVCESKEDCFFATYPLATRQCWLLTTTHPEKCNYHTGPHYGALLDPCTPAQPCPSAYKRCSKPNCSLQSIIERFCQSGSKRNAVSGCHP